MVGLLSCLLSLHARYYSQKASGSPRESVSGSGTTLSSWDSAWEPGGLAASLPSCTAQPGAGGHDERRSSITDSGSPLSPGPCLTSDRLWVPPSQPPGICVHDSFLIRFLCISTIFHLFPDNLK